MKRSIPYLFTILLLLLTAPSALGQVEFTKYAIDTSVVDASSVYATDVDSDGDTDVLSAADFTIAWYEQEGTPFGCPPGGVVFVDQEATGANDGTSWTDAFTGLQDALTLARSGACTALNEIWIAEGTYTPTTETDRTVSFTVTGAQDGLEIYGGFAGTETARSERDWQVNATILSGDIGEVGDASDNSYHVLYFDGTTGGVITPATVLDGVRVTAGTPPAGRPVALTR